VSSRRDRPATRFLFDELLPWRVASALEVLGFRTSHVGHSTHGAPAKGSSDEDVLAYAAKTNQVVVTSNHDMIMLCAEKEQAVVWLDPRGRQLRHDETVVLAFLGMASWSEMLESAGAPSCVRVLRSKAELISLKRARELAKRRLVALRRRRASPRRSRAELPGQLTSD